MERITDINYIAMNDNVLDLCIYNIKKSDDYSDIFLPRHNLFIKIDVRGNINIQKQFQNRIS